MWDNETTFSDKQPLAAGSSENIVDTGGDDWGMGDPVYLQVALSAGAAGALTVAIESADAADMSGAVERAKYLVDASVAGRGGVVLAAPLPTGCGRYLRVRYAGASGGTVTAGLVAGAATSGMRR